ncbi:hypothetical protein LI009_24420, partial [Flavonifractor plautii]|nr:hypothetical protein [Flavonifractor plautii]
MELYITGDTHGDFSRFRPESFYEQERLTKEDVILVAGDFGGVWYGDSRDDAGLNFLDSRRSGRISFAKRQRDMVCRC